jgi:hypothetical protein
MTNFPAALDALTNPLSTDGLTGHASQHANVNDAIEALEAKVGIDGSAVATSLDYKVAGLESSRELAANKGVAGGYAGLDGAGKVPAAQLPSYVDDVVEYANFAAFPATGEAAKIYVALDTEKIYRWSGSAYVEISPSPGSTDSVTEGATNLYFTYQRVRDTVLTGLSTATSVAIAATDSVLVALGKIQAQITAHQNAKDASGGYAGLTLFALNLRNVANTFTSLLTNTATAARTWTMPDKSGTVALLDDVIGPSFKAARSTSNQTITTGSFVLAQLNSEDWDTTNAFDSASTYRFTPQVAGYYGVSATVNVVGTGITSASLQIRKNGTAEWSTSLVSPSTVQLVPCVSGPVYMNGSTDYIELYGLANATTAAFGTGSTRFAANFLHS